MVKLASSVLLVLLCVSIAVAKPHKKQPKQQHPDPARTTQIQEALVKRGYPVNVTGVWDEPTFNALHAAAKDNGWSTCHVPDARVINWLGLGAETAGEAAPPPSHSHLADELAAYEKQYPERCDTWGKK